MGVCGYNIFAVLLAKYMKRTHVLYSKYEYLEAVVENKIRMQVEQ